MSTNILVFAVAAFFEIAGCFAFWLWLRDGASRYVLVGAGIAIIGTLVIIGFAAKTQAP